MCAHVGDFSVCFVLSIFERTFFNISHKIDLPPSLVNQVAESRRAEFSPAQFTGPKKISLNHLLNFTFEPRGGHGGGGGDGHTCWGRRNKWGHKHKPFNKELFLQAK